MTQTHLTSQPNSKTVTMSISPTKETSPVKADKALFTDKEERVLKAAWHCLKSPPEIDIEKLRVAAEFNTTKTAANTWGVIKKKLASLAPPAAEGEGKRAQNPCSKCIVERLS